MKKPRIGILTTLIAAIALILTLMVTPKRLDADDPGSWIPIASFVQIRSNISMLPVLCLNEKYKDDCEATTYPSYASGVVVGTGDNDDVGSFVLTAAHACDPIAYDGLNDDFVSLKIHRVRNRNGSDFDSSIVGINVTKDLCLLWVPGMELTPVKLSKKVPPMGELTYNVAAPLGIFSPGVQLVFDGRFSGINEDNSFVFTLPAQPGSSGSPIFNKRGKLISMVHSTATRMEALTSGASLGDIKIFLDNFMNVENIGAVLIPVHESEFFIRAEYEEMIITPSPLESNPYLIFPR